jgi:hypothetical protein
MNSIHVFDAWILPRGSGTESPICAIDIDHSSQRVFLGLADGTVEVLQLLEEDNFVSAALISRRQVTKQVRCPSLPLLLSGLHLPLLLSGRACIRPFSPRLIHSQIPFVSLHFSSQSNQLAAVTHDAILLLNSSTLHGKATPVLGG